MKTSYVFNNPKIGYCPRCKRTTQTRTKYFPLEEVKRRYCGTCGLLKQEMISFRKVDVIPIRNMSVRQVRNQKYLLIGALCIIIICLVALIKI